LQQKQSAHMKSTIAREPTTLTAIKLAFELSACGKRRWAVGEGEGEDGVGDWLPVGEEVGVDGWLPVGVLCKENERLFRKSSKKSAHKEAGRNCDRR
jgi:hypothetical protein